MKKILFIGFSFLIAFQAFSKDEASKFKTYRNWFHVKSMVIYDPKHPLYDPFYGIHHVYVNKKRLNTIKIKGKRNFPEGTKIGIVFYNHKEDLGAFIEGEKRIEAFMIKNSQKFKDTDGWGYFAYDAKGNSLVKDMKKDCHICHTQVKEQNFVFSLWKE
ncbi:MAG: cytochrome P460 family protein [Thermodesulfobacteriaceae bacterium]|nr:cytochrome P460 family protein [Thermodesulfobacteriaceae bacterium]